MSSEYSTQLYSYIIFDSEGTHSFKEALIFCNFLYNYDKLRVITKLLPGAADPGGPGGPGPPLKLEIYLVKFLEKDRISFFFLLGPPLEKNRSSAPAYA